MVKIGRNAEGVPPTSTVPTVADALDDAWGEGPYPSAEYVKVACPLVKASTDDNIEVAFRRVDRAMAGQLLCRKLAEELRFPGGPVTRPEAN